MSSFLSDKLARQIGTIARKLGEQSRNAVDAVQRSTAAAQTASHAVNVTDGGQKGQKAARMVKLVATASPVKEVARICGRAGVAGAVVDGAVGGMQAAKYMRDGKIDGNQAIKHTAAEAGCGFVTSSSGTAGTIAVYMVTGSMGPAALAAGMGASLGSRWVYRKIVGETLPNQQETDEDAVEESGVMEDIGPKPQDD